MSDHDDFTTAISTSSRTLDNNYLSLESRGGAGGPLVNTLREESKRRGLGTDGYRSDLQQRILKSNNSASPVERARYYTNVPDDITPGMPIPVRVEGFSMTVNCPEGLKAGDEFWFHSPGECFAYSVRKPWWIDPGMQFPVNFGDGRKMMVQCPEQVREDGYIRFMTPEQKQLVEQKRQQQEQKRQQQQQMQEAEEFIFPRTTEIMKQLRELEESRKQSEERTITQSIKQKEEITKQPEESAMQYEESWNRDCSTTLFQENKTPQQGGATDTTERNHQISNQVHSPNSSDRKVLRTPSTNENVDPQIVSEDVAPEAPAPTTTASASLTLAKPKSESTAGPELSAEEEKIAAKYRKMMKIGISDEGVRDRMTKEGVSDKIVEAIFGKEYTTINTDDSKTPAHRKNSNLKHVQVEASIVSPSDAKTSTFTVGMGPKIECSTTKLHQLFSKKKADVGKMVLGKANDREGKANLLGNIRSNNVQFGLKRFEKLRVAESELVESINDLDLDNSKISENLQLISELLPTPKELQALNAYKGESHRLNTAELFFQQLLRVKRIVAKVEVMKVMRTFNEHAKEARALFQTLGKVCNQVRNSEKLAKIHRSVVALVNTMNGDHMEAIKISSLQKLSWTKSADGKTTVLDFLVEEFIEQGERETLLLHSDFPDIQVLCGWTLDDLCGKVNTLKKNIHLCESELNSMKEDQAPKPVKSVPKKTNEGEAARKALLAAIQKGGTNDDDNSSKPPAPFDPRQALFADIKNRGTKTSNEEASAPAPMPAIAVTYSNGVLKLEEFVTQSSETLSDIEISKGSAIAACDKMAQFLCDRGSEHLSLLQNLSMFASSLVSAVEKHDKNKNADASIRQL